jgi:molybdate transport system substrate-binding protein
MLTRLCLYSALAIVTLSTPVRAAEVNFLCAVALRPVMDDLIPVFQQESGHKVNVTYATIGVQMDRVAKGDPADLVVVSPAQTDELQKAGKVSDPTVIAKVGVGVFVKKGAPKPDISTVDAFKKAVTNAKGISVPLAQGSPVEGYMTALFDRLGMSDVMKTKNKATATVFLEFVLDGSADFGFNQMTVVVANRDLDVVGPLPKEIQSYTVYTASIPSQVKERAAATALKQFLISPKTAAVLKTRGLEQD